MTPLDLKTKEEWEQILARFSGQIEMTACLTDDTGTRPLCHGDRYPLCASIKDNQQAVTFICSQTNTAMLAVVKRTLAPEIDLCEAGLIRVVVPVVREGELVGQVFACGLAPTDEEFDPFLVARQLGVPEERVVELARSTPARSEEELRPLVDHLFNELNPQTERTHDR
jgi:ligand-binding sensor protein